MTHISSAIRKQKQMNAGTQLTSFFPFLFLFNSGTLSFRWCCQRVKSQEFSSKCTHRLFQIHFSWWQRVAFTQWKLSEVPSKGRKLLLCKLVQNTWVVNHLALTPGRKVSDKTNRESSLFKLLLYCLNWWQHVIFFLVALTIICFI